MVKKARFLVLALIFCVASAAGSYAGDVEDYNSRRTPVVKAVEKARQSVVTIMTDYVVGPSSVWERFFPELQIPEGRPAGCLGSGVIVDEDGFVITNAHVVKRASRIRVKLVDGRIYEAVLINLTKENDLAVIKIVTKNPEDMPRLVPIEFGRSWDLMIGETAIAIGNPFGLDHTVTVGVVSAVNREVHIGGKLLLRNCVQTDAAINPGNSGGALVNINGKLIGINVAVIWGANTIGYSIPVDLTFSTMNSLISPKTLAEVDLGMEVRQHKRGVIVSHTKRFGPADKAGFRMSDHILAVDGKPVKDYLDFCKHFLGKRPGDKIKIRVKRPGEECDIEFLLAALPESKGQRLAREMLGLHVRKLSPYDTYRRGLGTESYLYVYSVDNGSIAQAAELENGDVLTRLSVEGEVEGYEVALLSRELRGYDDLEWFLDRVATTYKITVRYKRGSEEFLTDILMPDYVPPKEPEGGEEFEVDPGEPKEPAPKKDKKWWEGK